jgi:hypothetical protein
MHGMPVGTNGTIVPTGTVRTRRKKHRMENKLFLIFEAF